MILESNNDNDKAFESYFQRRYGKNNDIFNIDVDECEHIPGILFLKHPFSLLYFVKLFIYAMLVINICSHTMNETLSKMQVSVVEESLFHCHVYESLCIKLFMLNSFFIYS